jgi:hypothetical protein
MEAFFFGVLLSFSERSKSEKVGIIVSVVGIVVGFSAGAVNEAFILANVTEIIDGTCSVSDFRKVKNVTTHTL